MPHLNVYISQEAMTTAKVAAAKAGLTLKEWIEGKILFEPDIPSTLTSAAPPDRSRSGRPIDPIDAALASAKRGGRQA